jgi:hypothetical protein
VSDKEKPYLKLIRGKPSQPVIQSDDYDAEFEQLKGTSFKERMHWRGIEAKTAILGFAALSILASSIVLLALATWLFRIS